MVGTSSRVIVKNLPKRIDEKRLTSHFETKGVITDVKLMYTQSGRFRRFAFIGYLCPEDAAAAISYFNNTFIDTNRIEVSEAKAVGDPDIPRAWSRYSAGSSLHSETQNRLEAERNAKKAAEARRIKDDIAKKKAFLRSIYDAEKEDAELAKYIAASQPKSKTKTWGNDDEDLGTGGGLETHSVHKGKTSKPKVTIIPVTNKKPGGEGLLVAQTRLLFDSSESEQEGNICNTASTRDSSDDELYNDYVPQNAPINEDEDSDNTSDIAQSCDKDDTNSGNNRNANIELTPDLINDTARLFVRNLSYSCTEQDLFELFGPFGGLEEVHLSLSRETKKSKGFAYVKFVASSSAMDAYRKLDGTIFQGRLLHILPAKDRPAAVGEASGDIGGSYKRQKMAKQRSEAAKGFNWNSLFVRSDTVLNAIAEQLGVSKAEVMNPSSENLAIRLATAETHMIADTKRALESEGINLKVFETNSDAKSKTVMIVKNFPFVTEKQEISKMFAKFGPIGRLVFPSSRAIAVVEFLEANDAKTAFRSLAYTNFRNSPLFLEFAPEGILMNSANSSSTENGIQAKTVAEPRLTREENEADIDAETPNDTLYIKNISFDTAEDTLMQLFSSCGPLKSVTIPRKRNIKRPETGLLSMGFAFVQFVKAEHANLALDRLQGALVDGHSLVLRRSDNSKSETEKYEKRKSRSGNNEDNTNTTLMVRNIPFEASEREVRELFRNFAQVKRVRVPRKFDGGHRGFGFVDFVNAQEARNAMSALAHTHLYGRHLVIEWADCKENNKLEELREKAARNVLNMKQDGLGVEDNTIN